jgi:DNA invertase Pin-like site-specific DNA recombinase
MAALRLDGIVRVSKTGDRDTLRSPEQQEKDIRRWAKDHGHEIAHVHVAVDQTGRKRTGHPAIEAAKVRALSGVIDGVVAAYVSRFTRNTLYGLTTVAELLDAGKRFFAPECPFDLRTPEGRKYLTGLLAEAEYEGDVKARHFARGVEDAIERGAHLAAPFGLAKGNGKAESLTVVKDEAEQVKRAHELRAAGHSWAAIAAQLNASGAKPRPYKRDGKVMQAVWTHKTVRQLVVGKGPTGEWSVYLGMAFNGKLCVEDAHPAIVSPELFAAANDTRGTKFAGADGDAEYLLAGLVFCNGCGYRMTYNGAHSLRCRTAQHGAGRCPDPAACPAPQVKATGAEVRDAEAELAEAKAQARGNRLPVDLGLQDARRAPISERRHWLSLVNGAVVVRSARVWREPVADRSVILARDAVPTDSVSLRGFVAGQAD